MGFQAQAQDGDRLFRRSSAAARTRLCRDRFHEGAGGEPQGAGPRNDLEHETPLVIWSNRGGKVDELGGISPAFIPLQVLKAAGITHPYYTGFLGQVHDRFRVIDRNMLIDAGGKDYPDWARKRELDPAIRDFRFLQYDMMFDRKAAAPKFFPEMARPPS